MTDDDYDSYQKKGSRKQSPPKRNASRSTGREDNDLDNDQRFVPKSRPITRRKSSRRLVVESASAARPVAAAAAREYAASMPSAAASAARFNQDDLDDSSTSSRNNSWYADALLGGSRSQFEEILGGSKEQIDEIFGGSQQGNFSFEDEEQVLEQYRIMAQHEAICRVKENTGFDMAEYEKRKKMNGEGSGFDSKVGKRTKVRLPEPKRITSSNSTPKPEEPVMPVPRLNTRFLHQRMNRTPELCPGVVMRGGSTMPSDEHAVRCLGCKCQLRVKILASLVSCPDCSTVSSASSTRR